MALPVPGKQIQQAGWNAGVDAVIALFAAVIAWRCISWALAPDLFLCGDEIRNLARVWGRSYASILNIFPEWIYNDRPVGYAFLRLLFETWGWHYRPQLICQVIVHFGNCVLAGML